MQHPELPFFAFLAALLVLIPLPWHWRARNIATTALIAWLFVINMIYGINSIIWAGNINNPVPVWCDITTKLIVGASYALPLATVCICKHLEAVASSRKVSFDAADRKRRMIFELVMCYGLPLIFMALHYIVQGHRYDVYEDTGCTAAMYISVQAILIIWFPQLLSSVIALIYAALALHHFVRRRLTFASHLQNSNSALTPNRYIRLIAMALTEMFWGTSITAYNMYNNIWSGLRPWISWEDVHSNFSRVDFYATAGIPTEFLTKMMLFWWAMPASALIVFLFFGFGEEAKKEYSKAWTWMKATIFRRNSKKGSAQLPSYHRPLQLASSATLDTKVKAGISEKKSPLTRSVSQTSSFTTITPSTPTKSQSAETDDNASFTLSYYGSSAPTLASPPPLRPLSLFSDFRSSYDVNPRIPSIPPTIPSAVAQSVVHHGQRSRTPPSPVYHRPFSPPSVYPTTEPHPSAAVPTYTSDSVVGGIVVTIHRQASVDELT